MNTYLKRSLITGASGLMLLSIGTGVPNVNARNKSSVSVKTRIGVTKGHRYGVKKKLFPLALKIKHGYQKLYHDPFDESYPPSFDYFNVNTFKVLKPIRIERITRKHGQPEINNYADAYYVKRGSIIHLQNGASATY